MRCGIQDNWDDRHSSCSPSNFALGQSNKMISYFWIPLWSTESGISSRQITAPAASSHSLREHHFPHWLQRDPKAVLLRASSMVQEELNCSKNGMLLRTKHPDFMHSWGFCFKLALVWSIGLKAHEGQGVLLKYTFLFSVIWKESTSSLLPSVNKRCGMIRRSASKVQKCKCKQILYLTLQLSVSVG